MTWKVTAISDTGTSIKFGADDTDKIDKLLSGIDVDDVDINADWKFRSGFMAVANPANTFKYIFIGSAISANRNITIPLLTGADTLAVIGLAQTFSNKTIDSTCSIDVAALANDLITYAKIQNVSAASKILGRGDSGSGDVQEITLGANLTMTGTTLAATGGGGSSAGSTGNIQYSSDGAGGFGAETVLTYSTANNELTVPALFVTDDIALQGDISPTQLTANQNDYAPTNNATASRFRLDADSSFRQITGIANGADGRILILENISANTILLRNENASSSAANRFSFDNYDLPLFPKQEMKLIYDSTSSRWRCLGTPPIIPTGRYGFYYRNDMMDTTNDGTIIGNDVTGTGAANSVTATVNVQGHPGIIQQQTGTTSSGAANIRGINLQTILLGGNWYWSCEAMVRIPTASDGTNRFQVEIGFTDETSAAPVTDGVYAFYRDNVNTAQWVLDCNNNTTLTANNSTTAVSINAWIRIKVVVYPDATGELFINGVSAATSNGTNIPTGAGRGLTLNSSIGKSLGTTSRTMDIDYMEVIGYANTVS